MVLDSLEEEAQKIKRVLDKGNADLVCHVINEPTPAGILYGRYYGAGLTIIDVADYEERKQTGQDIQYYSMRIELASPIVPNVIDISDGSKTYRIRRTMKRRWGFKRAAYEVEKAEGGFKR
jgi:hypothetical protein